MKKEKYFTPTEINAFTRCSEQWRLDKALKQNKIFLDDEQKQIREQRFSRGNKAHEKFNQTQRPGISFFRLLAALGAALLAGGGIFWVLSIWSSMFF